MRALSGRGAAARQAEDWRLISAPWRACLLPCRMPIGLARNLTKQRPAGRGEAAGGDGVTQPLLPTIHSGQAVGDGEDESMQGDVEQAPPATDPLGWRTTIPGTLACVACLFVQKAVQQVRAAQWDSRAGSSSAAGERARAHAPLRRCLHTSPPPPLHPPASGLHGWRPALHQRPLQVELGQDQFVPRLGCGAGRVAHALLHHSARGKPQHRSNARLCR